MKFSFVVVTLLLSAASTNAFAGPFEDSVAKLELQGKLNTLSRYFPQSRAGELAKRATLLHRFHGVESGEEALLDEAITGLRRLGADSIAAIDFALARMPDSLFSERQFLLSLVSLITVDGAQKSALLQRELERAKSAEGVDEAKQSALSVIALHELSRVRGEARSLSAAVRKSIEARQSQESRLLIAEHFEFLAPEEGRKLRQDLRLPPSRVPTLPTEPVQP